MSGPQHTQGSWRKGGSSFVVADSPVPGIRGSDDEFYGGHLIAESVAPQNMPIIIAAPELYEALRGLLDRYVDLVNCGDCGNWNPEEEADVIAARAAIAKAEARS